MAKREQIHTHQMEEKALEGAVSKDRRGQLFGLGIAVFGLGVAAYVSTHSGAAAAVIAAVDLLGMVTVFVAPRILESRKSK